MLVFTCTFPCGLVKACPHSVHNYYAHSPYNPNSVSPTHCHLYSTSPSLCKMEDLCPISHKFVWIQESKYYTLLDDLQNIQSSMHTLVVIEDVEVAAQVTQFLDECGISVHNYDFDHKDQVIAQSFQSGEISILITTVEEDFDEEFTGTVTNVLVVDVLLFTSDQYLSYKELLAKPGGHLTFYVDNNNWLSMAFILKQLLEQGISITTDPYPPSPKSPSSPDSHPSMADDT